MCRCLHLPYFTHHTLHIVTTHHISLRHYLIIPLTLHTYPLSPTPHTTTHHLHTTHTLFPHTTHTLTPYSSPRARQVCGSESPYTLLVSSWGPVTHTSTSAGQCGWGHVTRDMMVSCNSKVSTHYKVFTVPLSLSRMFGVQLLQFTME